MKDTCYFLKSNWTALKLLDQCGSAILLHMSD